MSAFALHRIAEHLKGVRLSDSQEFCEIFESLRELRANGEAELGADSLRRLEAAGMLVGYVARMGALAGEDVRTIAVRLLREAAEHMPSPTGAPKLAAKRSNPAKESEEAAAVLSDMMLGQILLKRGHILDEHIHQALKVQRSTSQRLGEILVRIGACSQAQLAEALAHQAALRRVRKDSSGYLARRSLDKTELRGTGLKMVGEVLLGELLIQRNVITRRQLERALEVQKKDGLRIGEALVKIGATTIEQIELALRIQGRDRRFGIKAAADKAGADNDEGREPDRRKSG